jgi:hypothetical protein
MQPEEMTARAKKAQEGRGLEAYKSCSETSVSEQQPFKSAEKRNSLGQPPFFARLVQ